MRQILMINDTEKLAPWHDQLAGAYVDYFFPAPWSLRLDIAGVKDYLLGICNAPAGVIFVSFVDNDIEAFLIAHPARDYIGIEKIYSQARTGVAMLFELIIIDKDNLDILTDNLVSELQSFAEKQMFSYLVSLEIEDTEIVSALFSQDFSKWGEVTDSVVKFTPIGVRRVNDPRIVMEKKFEWSKK